MESIVVPDGVRYDRCQSCGRLWAVEAGRFELMVDAEVMSGDTLSL